MGKIVAVKKDDEVLLEFVVTDAMLAIAKKLGVPAKEYILALTKDKLGGRTMSRCEEKFHEWFSEAYSKLPEGKDFLLDDEFMYDIWKACWSRAYGVGHVDGRSQVETRYRTKETRERHRMPEVVMRETFTKCLSAREFGLAIEKWHGITGEEKF